ncbi:hypothetical protein [Streptomonospora wellingtoniae]|uniref:Integral membrane protein n=1 Tax=Streptomonospora wellingtoniae TaxID=3075544 RepID=A0ABU2KY12_9ACTN|nr:hypothetical protein [Streptomonospora sp. DSM 45055]MDT0304180.1 hypothetical protein [Streptomonospora sp. DSM 45055]
MTEQAAQLVLQYLSRVADAAYGNVSARHRAAYLADLRSRIDRACAAAGAESVGDVRRILHGFGRPAELLARELDAETSGSAGLVRTAAEEDDAEGAEERRRAVPAPDNRPAREPPPWRSGARPAARRPRPRPSGGAPAQGSRTDALAALPAALRRHPGEAAGVLLYLVAGAVGPLAAAWLVGAAIVALSRVWTGLDKAAGLGLPVLATLVGMALWESGVDHIYFDQIIWKSLTDTGVIGLRAAALATGAYLALQLGRR